MDEPKPKLTKRQRIAAAIRRMAWAYLFVAGAFWLFLQLFADRWWLGTLILFGPLWVLGIPLLVYLPAAFFFRRRSLWVLAAATYIVVFPICGYCIPWRKTLQDVHGRPPLRLVTCNVHGKAVLSKLVDRYHPDVIVLQEWPRASSPALLRDPGWHVRRDGELLIASRYSIESATNFSELDWDSWGGAGVLYELSTPDGPLQVIALHLASPHRPFEDVIHGRSQSIERLKKHIDMRFEQSHKLSLRAAAAGPRILIAGDFNTPCEGEIYRAEWSQFADAFTIAGLGQGHTYFAMGANVRIDHVMMGSDWLCRKCWVGPSVGSPHHPLIVDLQRTDPPQKP